MKIIFDQNVPRALRKSLQEHDVKTAAQMQWSTLENGDLLKAAEAQGFALLITGDRRLRYQQNLSKRIIGIFELTSTHWPSIKQKLFEVSASASAVIPGSYIIVQCPRLPSTKERDARL